MTNRQRRIQTLRTNHTGSIRGTLLNYPLMCAVTISYVLHTLIVFCHILLPWTTVCCQTVCYHSILCGVTHYYVLLPTPVYVTTSMCNHPLQYTVPIAVCSVHARVLYILLCAHFTLCANTSKIITHYCVLSPLTICPHHSFICTDKINSNCQM